MKNPLALIIKEKTLGNIVTNAKGIRDYVTEKIKEYSVDNYKGDAKQAAKDRAEINSAIKTLSDQRISLEKEWNVPFQEFKDIVTETTNMMKSASSKLDAIVKAKEEAEKAEKREQIEELWESKKFNLVTLDRVFSQQWLNKTCKITTVDSEMDTVIKEINNDLKTLDEFGEDTAILKDIYLSTLNLRQTLNKGAELKANRERLAQLEAEKKAREEQEALEEQKLEVFGVNKVQVQEVEQIQEETQEEVSNYVEPIVETTREVPQVPSLNETVYTFNIYGEENDIDTVRTIASDMGLDIIPSITLMGKPKQIELFKELLVGNKIGYEKKSIINLETNKL